MRRFLRVGAIPPTLRDGKGKAAATENVKAHAEPRAKEFPGHWSEPDVRGLLHATFGHVCAYCGRDLSKDAPAGQVEHYRPKGAVTGDDDGGYWWLAYEFENYTLSCSTCNNRYKRTRFPLLSGRPRVTFDTRDQLATEARALLHPCEDDVEKALCVDIKKTFLNISIGSDLDETLAQRADTVLRIWDKFYDTRFIQARREVLSKVLECIEQGKVEDARRAASRYAPHSQIARAVLQQENIQVPTADEELGWLTRQLVETLDVALALTEEDLQRKDAQNDAEGMCYALAGLLLAPPVGSPETVRHILEEAELLDDIDSYAQKLNAPSVPASVDGANVHAREVIRLARLLAGEAEQ